MRRGRGVPWQKASCSSGFERHVQEFGWCLSVFEALGDHAEGEGLDARHGFITVRAVAHDASQVETSSAW
jgi:hypothetical protein